MVYFFQAPEVRGKLNVQAADAAGVPRHMRSLLTRGESVQVDDEQGEGGKRWVRPEECLLGGGPGPAMIVVSCSPANLEGLLASKAFHRYQPDREGGENEKAVSPHVVVHRVEQVVWADERYQGWMRSFGKDAQVSVPLSNAGKGLHY
jgi:ribonuclease Z